MKVENKTQTYNEIWDDLVAFRSLILALALCISFMAAGYYFAPDKAPYPLFMGLGGALTGFIISSFLIKPKRIVIEEK